MEKNLENMNLSRINQTKVSILGLHLSEIHRKIAENSAVAARGWGKRTMFGEDGVSVWKRR
jgi:hypothetical protein